MDSYGVKLKKELLIDVAREKSGDIHPCTGRTWETSFTENNSVLFLWYVDENGSTRLISEDTDINEFLSKEN